MLLRDLILRALKDSKSRWFCGRAKSYASSSYSPQHVPVQLHYLSASKPNFTAQLYFGDELIGDFIGKFNCTVSALGFFQPSSFAPPARFLTRNLRWHRRRKSRNWNKTRRNLQESVRSAEVNPRPSAIADNFLKYSIGTLSRSQSTTRTSYMSSPALDTRDSLITPHLSITVCYLSRHVSLSSKPGWTSLKISTTNGRQFIRRP